MIKTWILKKIKRKNRSETERSCVTSIQIDILDIPVFVVLLTSSFFSTILIRHQASSLIICNDVTVTVTDI